MGTDPKIISEDKYEQLNMAAFKITKKLFAKILKKEGVLSFVEGGAILQTTNHELIDLLFSVFTGVCAGMQAPLLNDYTEQLRETTYFIAKMFIDSTLQDIHASAKILEKAMEKPH